MFKMQKSNFQRPYNFDVAAQNIMQGWKSAGQPIFPEEQSREDLNDSDRSAVINYPENDNVIKNEDVALIKTEDDFSIDNLIQHANDLGNNSSTTTLLQQARTLAI